MDQMPPGSRRPGIGLHTYLTDLIDYLPNPNRNIERYRSSFFFASNNKQAAARGATIEGKATARAVPRPEPPCELEYHFDRMSNKYCFRGNHPKDSTISKPLEIYAMTSADTASSSAVDGAEKCNKGATMIDLEESMRCLAAQLSVENAENATAVPEMSLKKSDLKNWETIPRIECPSLSLLHEDDDLVHESSSSSSPTSLNGTTVTSTSHLQHKTRQQTEEYAVALLARPLMVCSDDTETSNGDPTSSSSPSMKMGRQVLQQLADSLATLVHSRLRAYLAVLASHGLEQSHQTKQTTTKSQDSFAIEPALLKLQHKLLTLLEIGEHFQIVGVQSEWKASSKAPDDSCIHENEYAMDLEFSVQLEALIPTHSARGELSVPVNLSVTGTMIATTNLIVVGHNNNHCTESICIVLDTRRLLTILMEQAARIVATVVDVAQSVVGSAAVPRPPHRSASFWAMPPPPAAAPAPVVQPQVVDNNNNPLELLSQAAASTRIVSPDLQARQLRANLSPDDLPPPLALPAAALGETSLLLLSSSDDVVSQMSADQCADVIDGVLDAVDGHLWSNTAATTAANDHNEPPAKRRKA